MPVPHDAFISYSHQTDAAFGPALEKGLEQLARPWWKRRACDVFLDQSSLGIDTSVWGSIEPHLEGSRWFILLASPASAQSPWCRREVAWWLARHGTERLLIVVTDGEVHTQPDGGDFDWPRTTALPDVLAGRYTQVPLFGDLRPVSRSKAPSMQDPAFRRVVVGLAATMRGVPRDALDAEDLAAFRRNRRVLAAAAAAFVGLAALAGFTTVGGLDAGRSVAAAQLLDSAHTQGRSQPAQALLKAALAQRLAGDGSATVVLADILAAHPNLVRTVVPAQGGRPPVTALAIDGGANLIAVAACDEGPPPCRQGTVRFEPIEGNAPALPSPRALALGTVHGLALADRGTVLLVVADDGAYRVDLRAADAAPQLLVRGQPVVAAALSADGALFAAALGPPGSAVDVKVWHTGRGIHRCLPLSLPHIAAHGLVWSASGRYLALTDGRADTRLLDLDTCAQTPQTTMRDTAAMAFDGDRVFHAAALDGTQASAPTDGSARARRFGGRQPLVTQSAWLQRSPHALSADARWLALADGEQIRIDPAAAPDGESRVLQGAPAGVTATRWSADGRWLLSTHADGSTVLWRLQGPAGLASQPAAGDAAPPAGPWHEGRATRADGALAAVIDGRDLRAVDGDTPRRLWTLQLVATAGEGAARRVVELASGEAAIDPPQALQFGADGTLWVRSEQGVVTRWDIGPAALEARACRLAGRAPTEADLADWLPGQRLLRWRAARSLPCAAPA